MKHRFFGRADRNISRLVELGQNLDVLVAPVETYLVWSNWSKHRYFGRSGRNLSGLVEPSRNIEVRGRADRNIPRLVDFGPNLDVLVAPVKTYLAWSNWSEHITLVAPVETYLTGGTWSISRCFGRAGQNISRLVELGRNIVVLVALVETYLTGSNLVETKKFVVETIETKLA